MFVRFLNFKLKERLRASAWKISHKGFLDEIVRFCKRIDVINVGFVVFEDLKYAIFVCGLYSSFNPHAHDALHAKVIKMKSGYLLFS